MTDANRAAFRRWLADMVAVATSPTGVMRRTMKHHYPAPDELVVEIGVMKKGKDTPPLTTAQQLALSVLVGEPDAAVLSALCDCLIEMGHEIEMMGHEYAAAVAEKARAEERLKVVVELFDMASINAREALEVGVDVEAWRAGADIGECVT